MTPTTLADAHVAIVGLGLMGASLGLDLRGACRRVTGVVRRPEAVAEALAAACVDEATTDAAVAVAEADLVILATPVRTILRQIGSLGPLMRPGAVLLDLGSTKAEICRALEGLPPQVQAIGGHPMCGKEEAGLAAAEAGLYRDCTFVLCPLPATSAAAKDLALALVNHIAARPLFLDPERHDRLVASISHLPYLAACALVAQVSGVARTDPLVWQVAAGGFRDSSRVAASDVTMLLDILLTNRQAVFAAIDDYQARLRELRQLMQREEEGALRVLLQRFATTRQQWGRGMAPAIDGPDQP